MIKKLLLLVACAISVSLLKANNCSSPITITSLPFSYTGTTCGEGNDFPAPLCGNAGWGASEDMVFEVYLEAGTTIEITLSFNSGKAGVFLFNECDPLACNITLLSDTSFGTWCVTIPATGTWYIVVEDSLGCDSFSLQIIEDNSPPTGYSMFWGTINACSGTLYDPGGPNCNYPDNALVRTVICPSVPGQCVQLDFTSFDLENSFDYLYVFEGNQCANAPVAAFTGNTLPPPVQSTGIYDNGCLTLYFYSDATVNFTGFSANISCVPCVSGPLTGATVNMQNGTWYTCSGNFYDSGGPLFDYSNNEDYMLVICPSTPGQYVTVSFTSFDVENGFDFLYIFDGIGNCGACLGSFTGTTSPGTITASSPSGCLTFWFQSDGLFTRPGWSATVSCSSTPGTPSTPAGSTCQTPLCLLDTTAGTYTPFESECGEWIFEPCSGCPAFSGADYLYFFTFTIATGGTLQFTINPATTHDFDWALWRIDSIYDCSQLGPPIRASWDAPPPYQTGIAPGETDVCECAGGTGYVAPLTVNAGESYLLVVNDWTAPPPESFTLDFTGTTATFSNNTATCPSAVLPLSLIRLRARSVTEGIELSWFGFAPEGFDGYVELWKEIPERGENYRIHKRLVASGPFSGSFIDNEDALSPLIYRIALYDIVRDKVIAEDQVIVNVGVSYSDVSWFVNQDFLQVNISGEEPPSRLVLYEPGGKVVWEKDIRNCGVKFTGDQYIERIPVMALQKGIYLLEVEWSTGKRVYDKVIIW